jgi:hypothetical protein
MWPCRFTAFEVVAAVTYSELMRGRLRDPVLRVSACRNSAGRWRCATDSTDLSGLRALVVDAQEGI